MSALVWSVGASVVVSLISLVGIFSLLVKEGFLNKILILLIAFSAGGLIGGAFFHLLPEAIEIANNLFTYGYLLIGFIFFFALERYLLWHHCHKEGCCDIHPFGYLNMVGDSAHNFIDGLVIGSSFVLDTRLGIATTVVIILHEIPQEIGDFGVLVYSGFSKTKALYFNFITALTAIVGSVVGVYCSSIIGKFSSVILPLTAGGFIYIACCDLIPEIHRQSSLKKASHSMLFFIMGILFMLFMRILRH